MSSTYNTDQYTLAEDGFTVARGVLSSSQLAAVRTTTQRLLHDAPLGHFGQFRHHGSMLPVDPYDSKTIRDLILNPRTLDAMRDCGFKDPKWLSGYLISKPPRSPSLWWHQDWWAWGDPSAYADFPPQMFVMNYLSDTTAYNGALRVIPGSHRQPHPLHVSLPEAHGTEIGDDAAAHAKQPDEITVGLRAGDIVIGDARVLHATHRNDSPEWRTCVTLWYLPQFADLSESVKSYLMDHPSLPSRGWWDDESSSVPEELQRVLPIYEGHAPPAAYQRMPPAGWLSALGQTTKRK